MTGTGIGWPESSPSSKWQWTLREYPEFATGVGDTRFNDKLTDLSAPAMDRRKAHERDVLGRLRTIGRDRLTGQDVVSYDLALRDAEQDLAFQRFPAGKIPSGGEWLPYFESMPVSQMGGVHIDIPALPRLAPLRNTTDPRDCSASHGLRRTVGSPAPADGPPKARRRRALWLSPAGGPWINSTRRRWLTTHCCSVAASPQPIYSCEARKNVMD